MTRKTNNRADVYTRVTDKIIAELENGVRPWMKPWNAEHAAGRISKPLRFNGQAYNGINVLMLWSAAMEKDYAAPIWMTFRQAKELGANVRKGEKGELVVYANKLTRTEKTDSGDEIERTIPFPGSRLGTLTAPRPARGIRKLPHCYLCGIDIPPMFVARRISVISQERRSHLG